LSKTGKGLFATEGSKNWN